MDQYSEPDSEEKVFPKPVHLFHQILKLSWKEEACIDNLLLLDDYYAWILYTNGKWILCDLVSGNANNQGEIQGEKVVSSQIAGISTFDGKKVEFCNVHSPFKLQVLDHFNSRV